MWCSHLSGSVCALDRGALRNHEIVSVESWLGTWLYRVRDRSSQAAAPRQALLQGCGDLREAGDHKLWFDPEAVEGCANPIHPHASKAKGPRPRDIKRVG